jgi:hypothetical protein
MREEYSSEWVRGWMQKIVFELPTTIKNYPGLGMATNEQCGSEYQTILVCKIYY